MPKSFGQLLVLEQHGLLHTISLRCSPLPPLCRLHCNKGQSHCWHEFAGNTMTQYDHEGEATWGGGTRAKPEPSSWAGSHRLPRLGPQLQIWLMLLCTVCQGS